MAATKRRRAKAPAPLGVLEFSSALNGDDPHLVLEKLRHFVGVVGYERRWALSPSSDGCRSDGHGDDAASDDGSSEGDSVFSIDEEGDVPSPKRQKVDGGSGKMPSWQVDKKGYAVPFVGTSVSKGATGTATPGLWPTGFLEAYRKHSPSGVELVGNDYISAIPPGGIHKTLSKESEFSVGTKKKGEDGGGQSRGEIISMALQTNYWMALSEWILGFVSVDTLQREMGWEEDIAGSSEEDTSGRKGIKCSVPPAVMTILMKQRLPEWVGAVHDYATKQRKHAQQMQKERQRQKKKNQQQQKQKQSKEEQLRQQQIQQQQDLKQEKKKLQMQKQQRREEKLLLAALRNLIALCHLSDGTAREVLRKLTTVTDSKSSKGGDKGGAKPSHQKPDGASWMMQVFQQQGSSSLAPQVECLRLVCTLLETNDTNILSRLTEVPAHSHRQGGKFGKGGGSNTGLVYVALQHGTKRLLELAKVRRNDGDDDDQDPTDAYGRYMTRMLRGVRDIILPSPSSTEPRKERDDVGRGKKGFILGFGPTADLFSGLVINNLAKLSSLAPPFDATTESIKAITNGTDVYNHLSPAESVSVDARRILFLLLNDTLRSPFLHDIHHSIRTGQSATTEEQASFHLAQLSKALQGMLADQGRSPSMKAFLGVCLDTTPELMPHFFRGLQLSDPRPSYRSLEALAFVEGVLRDAPVPPRQVSRGDDIDSIAEQVLSTIVPPCVSKNQLGKVVQSESALLVSSGLKLIVTLVRRALHFVGTTVDGSGDNSEASKKKSSISEAVMGHLLEISLLFSIPSRFDPFDSQTSRANAVVMIQLCEALQCYAQLDPQSMANVKFDWTKLVPIGSQEQEVGGAFLSAEPLVQHRILQTLHEISRVSKVKFSTKMLATVQSILVSTKIPEVYEMARTLALALLEGELFSDFGLGSSVYNTEAGQCHKYEASLWIDGISDDTVQELAGMVEDSQQQRVQNKIMISQAWSNASMGYRMPSLGASSLLSWTVHQLMGGESSLSDKLSLLLVQISLKMLLFQANPEPFAAVIAFSGRGSTPSDGHTAGLLRVAKSILDERAKANACIKSLASAVFGPETFINKLAGVANGNQKSQGDQPNDFDSWYTNPAAMRQCLSMMKHSGGENDDLNSLLRKIIVGILEASESIVDVAPRLVAMFKSHSLKPAYMEGIVMLLLSAMRSKQLDLGGISIVDHLDSMKPTSSGMEVVSELLRCTLIPAHCSRTFVSDVCRYCSSALKSSEASMSSLRDFSMMVLLHLMPSKEKIEKAASYSPGLMFDLWVLAAGARNTALTVEFSARIEGYLAAMFDAMDGQGTWTVYKRICDVTHERFVGLCLKFIRHQRDFSQDGRSFLPSVLEYDCSGFSGLSDIFASISTDAEMAKLWVDGSLDHSAAAFVMQMLRQKSANAVITTKGFAGAVDVIGSRYLSLLTPKPQTSAKPSIAQVIDVLEALCSKGFIPSETHTHVLKIFNLLEERSIVWAIDHEEQLIKLATCVGSSPIQGGNTTLLLVMAFLRCCSLLPKCIKKMLRTKGEVESHRVESLLEIMSSLLKHAASFDVMTVTQASNAIDGCIVACLKYGMMDSGKVLSCSLLGGCLKIIRLLMAKSSYNSAGEIVFGSLTPSQIHSMAISHSSFQTALSRSDKDAYDNTSDFCKGLTQQLELIRLLLCSLSLGGTHVKIGYDTWTSISSVYNASTSIVHRLIRRLMFLYERNGSCEDELLINDLRWGPQAAKHSLQKDGDQSSSHNVDESWEWLFDALELERVRATLSQFPVTDTLVPVVYEDIECGAIKLEGQLGSTNDLEGETDDDSSVMSDDKSSWQRSSSDQRLSTASGNIEWRGGGDDLRYSPGFILPLILAALESQLPAEQSDHTENYETTEAAGVDGEISTKSEDEIAQCQSFANMCRRVCDRGGIALAIASLASRCPSIRKVAMSICALFLRALQMEEAHNMKSWRERPQQEMIMSSIQRGLAVRRAIQIQRHESQGGVDLGETQKFNVPMLPAVSAIFLAKALLVLSKPRDDLYGQMNRYFLRLMDYHGAFQDFFGLPSFLSLYCSVADDITRCRMERNWALLTLKDGAADEFAYRIISQHHVPELITTSFDSLLDHPESRGELYLTMDVIENLLRSGGARAANQLIQRQGLLSWLHGIAGWRNISSVLPNSTLKRKFLELVTTAVKANGYSRTLSEEDTTDDAFYEKVPLANAVVSIFLSEDDNPRMEGDFAQESATVLLEPTCDALWAIHETSKTSQVTVLDVGSTSLREATSLLTSFVRHAVMFGKVLTCLCDLPLVTNDDDPTSAEQFAGLTLLFILDMGMQLAPRTVILSLKRVHELVVLHPHLAKNAEMISNVKKCRHLAVLSGGVDDWDRFLPYLEE